MTIINLRLTNEIWNDAGLLREYVTQRHGSTLTFGGGENYWRAVSYCRRLARMTGISIDEILKTIRADYLLCN